MTKYYNFILIDTGIIVAFYNKKDRAKFSQCTEAYARLAEDLAAFQVFWHGY